MFRRGNLNSLRSALELVALIATFATRLKRMGNRRLVRVVEGASLESLYTGNCIEGSNPPVSARIEMKSGFWSDFLFADRICRNCLSVERSNSL
jgi:hypothetical protein